MAVVILVILEGIGLLCRLTVLGLILASLLAACGGAPPPPTIVKTQIVPCPARAPQETCAIDLPVDVGDADALDAYIRGSTPRAISQRLEGALRGWAGCAAEVSPWRTGYGACPAGNEQP